MNEPLLSVRGLRVEIATPSGHRPAVDDVSFDLEAGAALGLVGESGCGKSTTLRAIMGLPQRGARVAGGSITFDGVDLTRARRRGRRAPAISMVFQEPTAALNPVMRVGAQVAEAVTATGQRGRAATRREVVRLLERTGIPDAAHRARAYPHELSGGMRQRVVIAMALAGRPRLLLCDEPTTALDVTVQDQILTLLANLRDEEGLALVYVSHDLAVVSALCERTAVMYAGRIVEVGATADVLRAPHHPYTAGLLRALPAVDSTRQLSAIPGSPPDLATLPSGCRFRPRCDYAQPDCAQGEFALRPTADGGRTACIHPDSITHHPLADNRRSTPEGTAV